MDLLLWRHAEAEDWIPGCDDFRRELTARGEKQAKKMAEWLDRQLPASARVLVSPAHRTLQTAQPLDRKHKIYEELAPISGITVQGLLELVQWPTAKGTVLVIGHQPLLGEVVAQLMGCRATECAVKKGSVWWLRSRERDGQWQTVVITVQSPELL